MGCCCWDAPAAAAAGTGMATPHVTGAIALYAAAYKRNTGTNPPYNTTKAAVMSTGNASSTYTVSLPGLKPP